MVDSENNNYTATFIEDESNIENDQYYYQLDNVLPGGNYSFTEIIINDDTFNLNQNTTITDYLISDYSFVSSTEETITLKLNLDQNNKTYSSSYVNNSALNLGTGEEEGTLKYQFSFKVNNLNDNTTYNFVSLSFTNSFDESIDISEAGQIKTISDNTNTIIIWTSVIILVVFLLFFAILLFIDLKMKKKTKELSGKLNDSDFLDKS